MLQTTSECSEERWKFDSIQSGTISQTDKISADSLIARNTSGIDCLNYKYTKIKPIELYEKRSRLKHLANLKTTTPISFGLNKKIWSQIVLGKKSGGKKNYPVHKYSFTFFKIRNKKGSRSENKTSCCWIAWLKCQNKH